METAKTERGELRHRGQIAKDKTRDAFKEDHNREETKKVGANMFED